MWDVLPEFLKIALGALPATIKFFRPPRSVRELSGTWHSRYQREDHQLGVWADDKVQVNSVWPRRLVFHNIISPFGSQYKCQGSLRDRGEIVGTWRETQEGAAAHGTFHLFIQPFGKILYGLCSGPTSEGALIYGGWVLARDREDLDQAQALLVKAMLVGYRSMPPSTATTGVSAPSGPGS